MKLLLTSEGLSNELIINALKELVEKPFEKLKLAFIPTAANVITGDKTWLINDFVSCKKLGFSSIDIIDISAIQPDLWKPRVEKADVLLFGGGNTFHLMYWLEKSGLKNMLPELVKTKVYVGISAGSMVTTKNLVLWDSKELYDEDVSKVDSMEGLGFVDFQIRPHLNSDFFPNVRIEKIAKIAESINEPLYAIDDNTAIMVINQEVSVISTGTWKKF